MTAELRVRCDRLLSGGKGEYKLFGRVVPNLFFLVPGTERMGMLPLYGHRNVRSYGPQILRILRGLDSYGIVMLSEIRIGESPETAQYAESVRNIPPAWKSVSPKAALGVFGISSGKTYLSKTSHIKHTPFCVSFEDEDFFELPHRDGGITGWLESILAAK